MPSQIPSSFAAAAGQGPNLDIRNGGKIDSRGSGEWVRKDGKLATNGTLTLRRTPASMTSQSPGHGESQIQTQSESSVSLHLVYEYNQDFRYSKKELLDIYKHQQQSRASDECNVSNLFTEGWAPSESQESSGRAGWGKTNDGNDCYTPEICWDFQGDTQPLSLVEMSEEEKRLFKADTNSPFKPSSQNLKESIINGHKSNFSHGQGSNNLNYPSPNSGRPNIRRQQANDPSAGGIASPSSTGRFSRDDQSPFFVRKFDHKDNADERFDENKMGLAPSSLNRLNNIGSTLSPGQISPWTNSSSIALSPMGAFGNFALANANNSTSGEKKPVNSKAESRFFQPILKDNLDDLSKPFDKSWRPRQRTDTDPYADEAHSENVTTTIDDNLQVNQRINGLGTPNRGNTGDYLNSETHAFQEGLPCEQNNQTPRVINAFNERAEPLSPSDTNPYRSPSGFQEDRKQLDTEAYGTESHLPDRVLDLGGSLDNDQGPYGSIPRGFPNGVFDVVDRSQTSSALRSRLTQAGPLPSLGTIGSIGGWSVASGSPVGITDHESRPGFPSAFGNSIFSAMGDTQSPGHSSLTGMFGPPTNSISATGSRGSKLGSLFPASMQAQMQTVEIESSGENELRQNIAFGAVNRSSFIPSRETDSPVRATRHGCEDPFALVENARSIVTMPTPESSHVPLASTFNNPSLQSNQQSQVSTESVLNQQPPSTQQRIMVMPDRMRWLYLDPQAQVQGPFSGLEMHDWYKASFFTPNLSVKKLEDPDFEPLGQLIRRIGNSREPFLVPQIGIPHGKPSTQLSSSFTPPITGHGPGSVQSGAVQPPFANSFPSFGTTLTAEQQNNLERRKQEEQYLMARQREFLAQQQVNMKHMQLGGIPSVLHHHSSLHNVQSQPNFGGISSPAGIPPPSSHLTNGAGYFDGLARQISTNVLPGEFYHDEDPSRLTLRERHGQQVNSLYGQHDTQSQPQNIDDVDFTARLHEFKSLREQTEIEELALITSTSQQPNEPVISTQKPQLQLEEQADDSDRHATETTSIIENKQQNSPSKQLNSTSVQKDSPWVKVNTNIPIPNPPSQTISALPTPTSQKDRHNVTELSNFQKQPQFRTSDIPVNHSIAPWVKDPIQLPKPVSLKEMTDAEAKKAAKAEEIAAATRRENAEQEARQNMTQPVAAPPPGLPSTATWASSSTPHAAPVKSVWSNSVTKVQSSSNKQKTLADIQKEEELRKQKLITATANQSSIGSLGNKRYADLASKTTPNTTSMGGPTWVTVGAGGKVKATTGLGTPAQAPNTRSSNGHVLTLTNRTNPRSIAQAVRSNTVSESNNINTARDELTKWARATLEKHLNPGINVNEFVAMLNSFPSEESIIADSIYSQSQTMNGRDFAHEFIRRRNNAEKGIIELAINGSGSTFSTTFDKTGGWNEVAKKGPPKEEPAAGFKIVPNKKKGKK